MLTKSSFQFTLLLPRLLSGSGTSLAEAKLAAWLSGRGTSLPERYVGAWLAGSWMCLADK